MAWRDNITEMGSFRGAVFRCEKHDAEIGRRTSLKEYPGRDKPLVEDLGRASRKFTLDMYVLGENYDADRDALRQALEKRGAGELIHPWWGTMRVTLQGQARVTESTKQGGIAHFTATFIEAGDELDLVSKAATDLAVVSSVSSVRTAIQAQFARAFSVANAVTAVVQDAVSAIQDVASAINLIRGKIAAVLQVVDDAKAAIDAVVDGVTDLIQTPVTLATSLSSMVSTVVAGVNSIGAAFDAMAEFFGGEESLSFEGSILASRARVDVLSQAITSLSVLTDVIPPPPSLAAQQQEIKALNQESLVRLIKAECIAAVSETAVELTYDSYDQAQAMRESITDMIDDLLLDTGLDDSVYTPLADLRANLVEHFASVAAELPELQDYTPLESVPALVLAYQIYGDPLRELDILSRNQHIRDPSALLAGQSIRVLIDE
jgi:prophage DNA circulation protein